MVYDIVEVNTGRIQVLGRDINGRHDTDSLGIEIRNFRAEQGRDLAIDRLVPKGLAPVERCKDINIDKRVDSEQVLQHDNIRRNFRTNFRHWRKLDGTATTCQHVLKRVKDKGDLSCRWRGLQKVGDLGHEGNAVWSTTNCSLDNIGKNGLELMRSELQ